MEKPQIPIKDIRGREFDLAVQRERAAQVKVPAFDLEEWLSRKPTVKLSGDASNEAWERAENLKLEEEWLYSSPLPIELTFWNILVEPKEPATMTVGGLLLAPEVVQAEAFKTNIGRIVHMGSACYQSRTEGGIEMWKFRKPQVGDMIVHRHYTGLEMIMQENGKRLRIMDDTDVLGWVKDPNQWRMYL